VWKGVGNYKYLIKRAFFGSSRRVLSDHHSFSVVNLKHLFGYVVQDDIFASDSLSTMPFRSPEKLNFVQDISEDALE
jgi:hypothetical protein